MNKLLQAVSVATLLSLSVISHSDNPFGEYTLVSGASSSDQSELDKFKKGLPTVTRQPEMLDESKLAISDKIEMPNAIKKGGKYEYDSNGVVSKINLGGQSISKSIRLN